VVAAQDEPATSSGGVAPTVGTTIVVALYDGGSGLIRHIHTVQVLEGIERTDHEAAVAEARRYAEMLGQDVRRLGQAISNDPMHGSIRHRIEPSTGRFIPID